MFATVLDQGRRVDPTYAKMSMNGQIRAGQLVGIDRDSPCENLVAAAKAVAPLAATSIHVRTPR